MKMVVQGGKLISIWKSRLYSVWASMKQRCTNPRHGSYKDYGARGITICPMWAERDGIYNFVEWANTDNIWWFFGEGQRRYNSDAPIGGCTLDRKNNNGPYTPINCRWVTQKEQSNNTRANERVRMRKLMPKKSYKESHPNTVAVMVFDLDGNEIARFDNMSAAALALFGDADKRPQISYAATRSKKGTYGGYRFKLVR